MSLAPAGWSVSALAVLALVACAPAPAPPPPVHAGVSEPVAGDTLLSFSTDAPTYESGAQVELRLTNDTSGEVGYNLCASGLQRFVGGQWTPVPEDRVCTMELRILSPGSTATYEVRLPPDLAPGQYVYTTIVEFMQTGARPGVHSNTFGVTPGG